MANFHKIQRFGQVFLLGSLVALAMTNSSFAQPTNQCDLSEAIATITNRPENSRSQWGIAVQNIDNEQILYANNADKFFTPASNLKLLTTAAVLEIFGADYQFQTKIFTVGKAPHLEKLILQGAGDPTLTTEQLQNALSLLHSQGVTQIDEIILDDSYFVNAKINGSWEWSDLPWDYATSLNSLILNENVITATISPSEIGKPAIIQWSEAIAADQWYLQNELITTENGSSVPPDPIQKYGTNELLIAGELSSKAEPESLFLSIPDPNQYVVDTAQAILLENGITVRSKRIVKTEISSKKVQLLATITSVSLGEIIRKTNQESNNLFAESLLQLLIKEQKNIPEILNHLGVSAENYQLRDGSGLSRHNLATPMMFVQLLDGMAAQPEAQVYRDSLAIAAQTGTLRNRFKDTPISNHFFGKTGSMTNVATLSGYLDLEDGNTLALSILVNQSGESASVTRGAIDEIVGAVYSWSQCSAAENREFLQTSP